MVQTTAQVGLRVADVGLMVLIISLVIVAWLVLPLPFAVAVGRSFRAGHQGPALAPDRQHVTADHVTGDLAA